MWKSESGTMTDNNNTNSYRSFEEDEDFALGQDIPVDSTARVGTDVTFNCKDQGYSYVQWVEYASQGDTGVTVWHTGGQVSNPAKYEVDSTSANKYTLTIKNVQLTDVGKYECRTIPSAGPPKDYAAHLTVIVALDQDIPVDSAARVGTDVTFDCKDQGYSYVQWVEYASQGDTGVVVWHTGGQVSNPAKYEVDSTSANKYTLTIKNVQLTDVGRYECRTIAGPPKDYAAQLTVIPVAQPECCSGQAKLENIASGDSIQNGDTWNPRNKNAGSNKTDYNHKLSGYNIDDESNRSGFIHVTPYGGIPYGYGDTALLDSCMSNNSAKFSALSDTIESGYNPSESSLGWSAQSASYNMSKSTCSSNKSSADGAPMGHNNQLSPLPRIEDINKDRQVKNNKSRVQTAQPSPQTIPNLPPPPPEEAITRAKSPNQESLELIIKEFDGYLEDENEKYDPWERQGSCSSMPGLSPNMPKILKPCLSKKQSKNNVAKNLSVRFDPKQEELHAKGGKGTYACSQNYAGYPAQYATLRRRHYKSLCEAVQQRSPESGVGIEIQSGHCSTWSNSSEDDNFLDDLGPVHYARSLPPTSYSSREKQKKEKKKKKMCIVS